MSKYKKRLPEERQKEIEDLMDRAKKNMMDFSKSEEGLKEMTEFMAKFNNYSTNNMSLISSQYNGAKAVAGYNKWKEQGLNVRKGQKGIKIFAPSNYKVYFDKETNSHIPINKLNKEQKQIIKENPELVKTRASFYLTSVFDITQTDAKPEDYPKYYPNKPYNIKHEEELNISQFNNYIEKILDEKGIALNIDAIMGGAEKGSYLQYIGNKDVEGTEELINISDRISEEEKSHVLLHEVAHSKLHNRNEIDILETDRAVKEIEAEMSAYVVGSYYGLGLEEISTVYLGSWKKELDKVYEKEEMLKIYHNVKKASSEIISEIEKQAYLERDYQKSLDKNDKEIENNRELIPSIVGVNQLDNDLER